MDNLDNHKENIKDLAQTRKIKQSDAYGGAGTVEHEYTELKPTTFKEKWSNFWYHYILATVCIIIVIIFGVTSLNMYFNKSNHDSGLAFVTETPFDSSASFIVEEWKILSNDSNNDGELNVQIFTTQLDVHNKYSLDPTLAEANVTKFMGNIAAMDNMLYVVDEVGYSSLLEVGVVLHDISDLVDNTKLTQGVDKYPLKDTNLAEMVGIGNVLDDMYLCLVSYDYLPQKRQDNEEIKKVWENDLNFFKNLVAYN